MHSLDVQRRSVVMMRGLLAAYIGFEACGCNMTQLAVETQADIMERAYPAIETQTDYDFARLGIPANLVQLDGLLRVAPDNERLLALASQGYASYAYGFVEDEMQQAESQGDLEAFDWQRARARSMYLKARDYGLRQLRVLEPEFPEVLPRDPDQLARVLNENFRDPEQAAPLFWTGNALGSAINISRDDPALVADLPLARVLVKRSVELDETYYHASGHVFLGVANASLGESMGGNPAQGRQHFERALALTQRRALLAQVNYAQAYAVQKSDKPLFTSLLNEVLKAPLQTGALALPNTIAKRRARRLLAQVDTLILDSIDDLPASAPLTPGTPGPDPEPPAPEAAPAPAPAASDLPSPNPDTRKNTPTETSPPR